MNQEKKVSVILTGDETRGGQKVGEKAGKIKINKIR